MFEWYDFYLYGSLAAVIGKQFFSGVNETTAFIFALLAFAAGFAVRPFGALIFGRLGDLAGRKHTFLITIVLMGVATALVGVLPGYAIDRRRGADHSHHAASAAGTGGRRRVRRRGDIHRRARAARPARVLHELDPDHCDRWHGSVARRDPRLPLAARTGVRHVGLARAVSCCRSSCCAFPSTSGCSSRSRRCFGRCARRESCRKRRCANRSDAGAI